jgi:hypothetical protein
LSILITLWVFDDIDFNDIQVLNRIKIFLDNNLTKLSISTVNSEQLKPVAEITNQTMDYDEYLHMDSVMYQLFKHEVFLEINKIFKTTETCFKIYELKQILKSGNYNIDDLIERFLYTDDNNESENTLA